MIFLYILIGILALLLLFLFTNAVIRLEYKEMFVSKIYVLGIPLDLKKLIDFFTKQNLEEEKAAKTKREPKQETRKKIGFKRTVEDLYSFIQALLRAVGEVARGLKRHFKIHIKELTVTVATDDAAKTAMRYGEITALLSAFFALCEEHARFRADYRNIQVVSDFESVKMKAAFCIYLRIRPIHLLTTAARAYLAYAKDLLDMTAEAQNTEKKKGQ